MNLSRVIRPILSRVCDRCDYQKYGLSEFVCRPPVQWLNYRLAIQNLNVEPGDTILEIGVTGLSLLTFADDEFLSVTSITVLDLSKSKVTNHNEARKILGSIDALPFEADAFDHVVSIATIDWLPPGSRAVALEEIQRVAARSVVIECVVHDEENGFFAAKMYRQFADHLKQTGQEMTTMIQLYEELDWELPKIEEFKALGEFETHSYNLDLAYLVDNRHLLRRYLLRFRFLCNPNRYFDDERATNCVFYSRIT